jgi:hypothetical protein
MEATMRLRSVMMPLALGIALAGSAALAQSGKVYTTISGPELVSVFQNAGFRATLSTDNVGDPMIESSSQGVNFRVYFYGCNSAEPKRCNSLEFRVGFDKGGSMRFEQMNTWNEDRRYGIAYLDDDMDPWLEMNALVQGGVTEANLAEHIEIWNDLMGRFLRHIDW